MKSVSFLSVFNDLNGRIIYRPYEVFEEKENKKSDLEKFSR